MALVEYKEPQKFEINNKVLYIDGEKICSIAHFELTGKEQLELILHIEMNKNFFQIGGRLPIK